MALDFLLEKWSSMSDEEFIRCAHRAQFNREIEADALAANVTLLQDGRVSRSVFLDCLVSSKEFRDVLSGSKS